MAEADPQKTSNVHYAKVQLSRLMDRAHASEESVPARAGEPWAKIVPYEAAPLPPRKPGRFKGELGDVPNPLWFETFHTDEEMERSDRGSIFPPGAAE